MKMSFPSVEFATAAWIETAALVSEALCWAFRHFLNCGSYQATQEIKLEMERLRVMYYRLMRRTYSESDYLEFVVCLGLVPEKSRAYRQAQKLQAELLETL